MEDKKRVTLDEFNKLVEKQIKIINKLKSKIKSTRQQIEEYLLKEYEIII